MRKVSRQTRRDLACAAILVCAVACYIHNLDGYFAAMHKPILLILGFAGSLVFALVHDVNRLHARLSAVRCARTAIVFSIAVVAANFFRDGYVTMRAIIANVSEAQELLGPDAYSALTNPFVGYGGCFAFSLLFTRWMLGGKLERLLTKVLVLPGVFPKVCPCCANPI